MGDVMDSSVRMGHARDVKTILVENYCGSCGTRRAERHDIVKEHGTVYTHHPTAPALQVRYVHFSFVMGPRAIVLHDYGRHVAWVVLFVPSMCLTCSYLGHPLPHECCCCAMVVGCRGAMEV